MGHCHCYKAIRNDQSFHHYQKEEDRLGSEFDDFGYATYIDHQGDEHKFFYHKHLGPVESYSHAIDLKDEIKDSWKVIKHKQDNSVIPEIKKLLLPFVYYNTCMC